MTEADGWLPPDNFQEHERRVAHRTSPTNIGMAMLSTLAAHDLGYLSTAELIRRLGAMARTLESLERFHGHFLNWYDTATLAPLHPRYVSTVDSGNLAGSLIALAQGLLAIEHKPQARRQLLEALSDEAHLLAVAASSSDTETASRTIVTTINRLAGTIALTVRTGAQRDSGTDESDDLLPALQALAGELLTASSAIKPVPGRGEPDELVFWSAAVLHTIGRLTNDEPVSIEALHTLANRMNTMADAMRFDFLYDRRRRIFSVGYRLADADGPGRLDASFYDLLASEARLASFVAIAKGDVPQHHWFHLGRLVTNVHGRATLISWSGTMFEYLMPQLLMRNFPGTLLEQSCRASVKRQIDYARQRDVPWGISESAYALTDRAGNYQYRAFGVPGLGLQRGLVSKLVVSPYSTALASLVAPSAAAGNFARLQSLGLEGRYGFYESLDYTPRHRDVEDPPDAVSPPVVVGAYFAHHQGMSLVALANVVLQDVFVARFHADPRIQATELLLQERVPREAIVSEPRPAEAATSRPSLPMFASRRFVSPHTSSIHSHFLSNGRYTTTVGNDGSGHSMWGDVAVTRRREDPTALSEVTTSICVIHGRTASGQRRTCQCARSPIVSRRRSISTRSPFAAATVTSNRYSRSRCRRKTTSR